MVALLPAESSRKIGSKRGWFTNSSVKSRSDAGWNRSREGVPSGGGFSTLARDLGFAGFLSGSPDSVSLFTRFAMAYRGFGPANTRTPVDTDRGQEKSPATTVAGLWSKISDKTAGSHGFGHARLLGHLIFLGHFHGLHGAEFRAHGVERFDDLVHAVLEQVADEQVDQVPFHLGVLADE